MGGEHIGRGGTASSINGKEEDGCAACNAVDHPASCTFLYGLGLMVIGHAVLLPGLLLPVFCS